MKVRTPAAILWLATIVSWLPADAALEPEHSPVSAQDINYFEATKPSDREPASYRIELEHPLVRVNVGNQHILDIRIQAETLDVVFAWDVPANEFSFARVPWRDIRSHQVRYGLPEFYDPDHLPLRYKANPLPADPLRKFGNELSQFGINSPDVVGAKKADENAVYLFKRNRIVKLRLPEQILWEEKLPQGHTLIAFDVSDGLLWIATNSSQGSVDGELGLPLTTTQIYAISRRE